MLLFLFLKGFSPSLERYQKYKDVLLRFSNHCLISFLAADYVIRNSSNHRVALLGKDAEVGKNIS